MYDHFKNFSNYALSSMQSYEISEITILFKNELNQTIPEPNLNCHPPRKNCFILYSIIFTLFLILKNSAMFVILHFAIFFH